MPACTSCGAQNPDGFRFCGSCAAPLALQQVESGEERKVVSVLFCDLVGFTAASEVSDPEDVQRRLDPYHARVRAGIEHFGGSVEKYVGDAVMGVFGIPAAHEDDAERAVRAGLAILEGIQELNEAAPGLELQVRVGINTGEALVTMTARPETSQWMVSGDVTNTASRLQTAAPIDTAVVGEATFHATERVFEWEPLEPVVVKGKAEPVQLWRVMSARARFGSDVIRSLGSPLVGREQDLALLRGLFEKSARERSVQLVTVVGEPGVGKSRLVAELFAYIDGLPELVTWRQGRCLPYGDGITFWALSEIVKAHAGILESDSTDEADRKLRVVLPEGDDATWMRVRLLPLVGIDSGVDPSREESFTAWRRFLEHVAEQGPCVVVVEDVHWADDALLSFLEHLADWAQGVPLLVVCSARPELYERHSTWAAGLGNATAIRLLPLTGEETARLIAGLLHQAVLPAETQQLLLERAGGNPLYAEEFVRMLRDSGLLDARGTLQQDADVPFPDSIQALIAARLDTLDPDRKSLLQDAAVMGKVFWVGAVAAMGDRSSGAVEVALHELARKELVRPARQSSMEGERELGFWHILVRDVAYSQIPRVQRAAKHVRAATWLEGKAGERIEDIAEVLAYHTSEALELAAAAGDAALVAELTPRAQRFASLAGERALGLDVGKALQLLGRALELTPDDDPERPLIMVRWADAAWDAGELQLGAEQLQAAERLATSLGDVETAARALLGLGARRRELGDSGWLEAQEQAVAMLETLPPGQALVDAIASLSFGRTLLGQWPEAISDAERAVELAERCGLVVPERAREVRGIARCNLGDIGGLEEQRQAIEQSVAAGRGGRAAIGLNNLAIDCLSFEGPVSALAVLDEGESLASSRGLTYAINCIAANRISMLVWAGRLTEAIDRADAILPVLAATGDVLGHIDAGCGRLHARIELGDPELADAERLFGDSVVLGEASVLVAGVTETVHARLATGDPAGVLALVRELTETNGFAESSQYANRLPRLIRCVLSAGDRDLAALLVDGIEPRLPIHGHALVTCSALLLEARGEYAEAGKLFAESAGRWEAFGARLEQAYALLGMGRCLAALGDAGADVHLRAARAHFSEMGASSRVAECDALVEAARAMGLR